MAIQHAVSGQVIEVFDRNAMHHGARTVALFKTAEIEVIRLVLLAGKAFPPHKVAGNVTLQCLLGRVTVGVVTHRGEQRQTLSAGQLIYLDGGVQHDVVALEDAQALLTIVLRK